MQAGWMRLLPAVLLFCAVLAPSAASGSDNDERPAYMIYLDPETGQYTTEDPLRGRPADDAGKSAPPSAAAGRATASSGPQAGGDRAPGRSAGPVLVAAAILLLAAVAWGIRRKRHGRMLGGP